MKRLCSALVWLFAACPGSFAAPFETDGLTSLTIQQAREIVSSHKGTLSFRKLPEVPLGVAEVLAVYRGELRLNAIKSITPEVALTLSKQPKGANLCLNGLIEITPEVAKALAVRNGGMLSLNALVGITPEVAQQLGKVRAKLTLNGLQSLPVEVAQGLAKHPSKLTLFSVPTINDEAAGLMSGKRGTLLLHGLTHLSSPALVRKMLNSNDGFVSFKKVRTMTDEVANVFANYDGKKTMSLEGLDALPSARATQLRGNGKLVLPAHLRKPGITNSLGMRLAYIPAGKFGMGSPRDEPQREAQEKRHEVELTKEFYLGVHEVTVGQFKEFVCGANYTTEGDRDGKGGWGVNESGSLDKKGKYTWKSPGFEQSDDHPVVLVSWNDAQAFCKWLGKKENKTYRLPTEAEWEYACRAGTRTAYSFGDDPQDLAAHGNVGRSEDGFRYAAPVGRFEPNRYGLYDMHGNVWEWCSDWYDSKGYQGGRETDPTGPKMAGARVHRGGGWSSSPSRCRSAARIGRHPSAYRGSYLGFRVVLEQSNNPRIEKAADAKLGKEFDYLVYDLGKGVELKLVKVRAKGQTFTIGSSGKEQDAVVQKYFNGKRPGQLDFEADHTITLTDDFFIGRFEVTRGQFRRFVEDTNYTTDTEATDGGYGWNERLKKFEGRDWKYSWENYGDPSETDEHPVTNITRNDARKFCGWLAKKGDGKIRLREVRLPGEAEWEFACRAGSTLRFSFGDEDERLTEFANVADGTWAEKFSKQNEI